MYVDSAHSSLAPNSRRFDQPTETDSDGHGTSQQIHRLSPNERASKVRFKFYMTKKISDQLHEMAIQLNCYSSRGHSGPSKSAVIETILQAYAKDPTSQGFRGPCFEIPSNARDRSLVTLTKACVDDIKTLIQPTRFKLTPFLIHVVIAHLVKSLDCKPEDFDCTVATHQIAGPNRQRARLDPIAFTKEGEQRIIEFCKAHPQMNSATVTKMLGFNKKRVAEIRKKHNLCRPGSLTEADKRIIDALLQKNPMMNNTEIASYLRASVGSHGIARYKTSYLARMKQQSDVLPEPTTEIILPAIPVEDLPLFSEMVNTLWPEHAQVRESGMR